MSYISFDTLRSYYIDDPVAFMRILAGDTSLSKIYKDLVSQIVTGIESQFASTGSKIVRLDFDGNVMFSNGDPYFGQTKEDVKNACSRVSKFGDSAILVADALGKGALILDISVGDYAAAIESLFTDPITETDDQFIRAVFNSTNVVLNLSKVVWRYDSSRYITAFYVVPVSKRQITITDASIESIFARQCDTIEFVNESAISISVYSGKTTLEQFQLDPDLSLYGSDFISPILAPGDKYTLKLVTVGEYDFFTYPNILTGRITITKNRLNNADEFLLAENDGLESPFSSRIIKIDSWGNVLDSYGESWIVQPRNARPMINKGTIIST